jgi:hypothetical protein
MKSALQFRLGGHTHSERGMHYTSNVFILDFVSYVRQRHAWIIISVRTKDTNSNPRQATLTVASKKRSRWDQTIINTSSSRRKADQISFWQTLAIYTVLQTSPELILNAQTCNILTLGCLDFSSRFVQLIEKRLSDFLASAAHDAANVHLELNKVRASTSPSFFSFLNQLSLSCTCACWHTALSR